MSQVAILETRSLGRKFGSLEAVSDLSFSVSSGEILGVIGPNGAGKSTFINLVTGHIKPTSGKVFINGKDLTGTSPWTVARAGVSRTFQIVKPFNGMTVRENIAIGILYESNGTNRLSVALKEAESILHEVGLAGAGDKLPGELSTADVRRLEFAKALASRPQLLLLDEVMAGLRPTEIGPSLELIRKLRESGTTVIVVEHVMKAILAVSDRVLVLAQGKLLTQGLPHEVLTDPRVIEVYLGHRFAMRKKGGN